MINFIISGGSFRAAILSSLSVGSFNRFRIFQIRCTVGGLRLDEAVKVRLFLYST